MWLEFFTPRVAAGLSIRGFAVAVKHNASVKMKAQVEP